MLDPARRIGEEAVVAAFGGVKWVPHEIGLQNHVASHLELKQRAGGIRGAGPARKNISRAGGCLHFIAGTQFQIFSIQIRGNFPNPIRFDHQGACPIGQAEICDLHDPIRKRVG